MLMELAHRLNVSMEWLASGHTDDDETTEGLRAQLVQCRARIKYLERKLETIQTASQFDGV